MDVMRESARLTPLPGLSRPVLQRCNNQGRH
jgi:hypothetical protein